MHILYSIVFLINIGIINGQDKRCVSPNNEIGVCVTLEQCPSIINLYGNNIGNKQVYAFIIDAQKSCKTNRIERDPIICCTQPVSKRPSSFNTTAAYPTVNVSKPKTVSCVGPDTRMGTCKHIEDCPEIKAEYVAKSNDTGFISYIKSSNAICKCRQPIVCCPHEKTNTTDSIKSSTGSGTRLITVDEGCGVASSNHPKVVGGIPANLGAWPWMALLGYESGNYIAWQCGGTIITTRHVLSAAHCATNTLSIVRLGEHDITDETETVTVDIPVVKMVKHPEYSTRDKRNDIAIIFLQSAIQFTKTISPICLPTNAPERTKSYVGTYPFLMGWGRTQEEGKPANVLQELQIPVLDNDVCRDRFKSMKLQISEEQFGDTVLCAGEKSGGKDSCQGDSGGPLVTGSIVKGIAIHFQIGIVSYGIGCARTDLPSVYVRVQHFIDWIEQVISEPVINKKCS